MTSILSCNRCGCELTVVDKQGPHIHTVCANCGMDNSSMINQHALHEKEEQEAKETNVEIIRIRRLPARNFAKLG